METNSARVLPSAYTKDDHPSSPPLKSLQKTLCSSHVGNSGMLLDFLLADDDKDVNCNNKVYTPVTQGPPPLIFTSFAVFVVALGDECRQKNNRGNANIHCDWNPFFMSYGRGHIQLQMMTCFSVLNFAS
jgi:hypothetical protein